MDGNKAFLFNFEVTDHVVPFFLFLFDYKKNPNIRFPIVKQNI